MSNEKNFKNDFNSTIEKLRSSDGKVALEGLKNLLILHAQGEDLSSLYKDIALIIPGKNPTICRYRNIILSDTYIGYGTILADFQSDNFLLQSFAVKRAGLVITAESGDVLVPIIQEAAVSKHPHVRSSAALAIQKLEKNDTTLIELYKLDQLLIKMLNDPIISVSSNAAAAMIEINNSRSKPLFIFKFDDVVRLTKDMHDASEWCRIQILNIVSNYNFQNEDECFIIIENMQSHLLNPNSAVTIGVIRNMIKCFPFIKDNAKKGNLLQIISQSLLKLLSAPVETRFVVLKQFYILIQNFKSFFIENLNVSSFFCKKEDPTYIQLAKLDIIKVLTTNNNVSTIIDELSNYAKSNNEEVGKESVLELGHIALTYQESTNKVAEIIHELLDFENHSSVVETSIIVAVNILRQFPDQYGEVGEKLITLNYEDIEDPRAKSAFVWFLGDCMDMSKVWDLADNFMEESSIVKLSILATIVKWYIYAPNEVYGVLCRVFSQATLEANDPEVRDRAFSYLKVLSEFKQIKEHVFFKSQECGLDITPVVNKKLYSDLLGCLGSVATVLNKFPAEFSRKNNISDFIYPLLLERSAKTYDCEVRGQFLVDADGQRCLMLYMKNMGNNPFNLRKLEFKPSTFGFTPLAFTALPKIEAKQSALTRIPVVNSMAFIDNSTISNVIKVEGQVNMGMISFSGEIPLKFFLLPVEYGKIGRAEFNSVYPKLSESDEISFLIRETKLNDPTKVVQALEKEWIFFFGKKDNVIFFSGRTVTNDLFILTVVIVENSCKVALRMENMNMRSLILGLVTGLLK